MPVPAVIAAASSRRRTAPAVSQVIVEAVSAGNATKGSAGTPKVVSDTITVDGSKTNRLLLAIFTHSSGGSFNPTVGEMGTVSDVGGALTQVTNSQQPVPSNLGSVQWRYLLAPANGLHTVTGTYNGPNWANGVGMILLSLSGVDQAAPFGTPVRSSGNNSDVNNTVTADIGDVILWALVHSVTLSDLNQTAQRINVGSSDGGYGDYTSCYAAGGTGAGVQLFTSTDSVHACSGLPVLAA